MGNTVCKLPRKNVESPAGRFDVSFGKPNAKPLHGRVYFLVFKELAKFFLEEKKTIIKVRRK